MLLNNLKNKKLLIIAICMSVLNIGWGTEAQANDNSFLNKSNNKITKTALNPSLDLHLLLSRKLGPKAKSNSFESQSNLELSKTSLIPLHTQSVIAKSFGGEASWYGPGFHGRLTANGERYNQNALTAAHRFLRFGTRVKVTNLRNGRSVVVRINDRGPYAKGRVIDVSAAAARTLGMVHTGVAPVRIKIIGR